MRHTKPQPEPLHTAEPHPLAYCVEDAAKALGLGRTFVFNLIKDGELAAVRVGRRTLVTVKECEAFLVRNGGVA